jgi:hypothetical protein
MKRENLILGKNEGEYYINDYEDTIFGQEVELRVEFWYEDDNVNIEKFVAICRYDETYTPAGGYMPRQECRHADVTELFNKKVILALEQEIEKEIKKAVLQAA